MTFQRIQKRRKKILFKKIAIFVTIFCITLITLETFAWITIYHRPGIISPIARILQSVSFKPFANTILIHQVASELKKNNIVFTNVTIASDGVIHIQLQDNQEALFSQSKDIHIQIASLQLAMNDLTIEGKPFKRLDFRFDKPVVTF